MRKDGLCHRLSIKIKWQDGGGSNGKQKENGKADR
jgi:hypothetical protein